MNYIENYWTHTEWLQIFLFQDHIMIIDIDNFFNDLIGDDVVLKTDP